MRQVLLRFAVCWLCGNLVMGNGTTITSLRKPQVVIDLARLGWKDSPPESDKSFFKTYSIEKLEAMDGGAKLLYLSNDVLVAYHAIQENQENKDWRSVRRELEAFFISTHDGSLVFRQRWRTRWRKDSRDLWESEARIIRVSGDRFLVHADAALMLYSSTDYRLLKAKALEPAGLGDLWGAQSVPGGRYILLRHGHLSRMYATYEWLTSETLETMHRTESYELSSPTAMEESIVGDTRNGIQELTWDGHSEAACRSHACLEGGELTFLGPHSVAFLSRTAVGVIDTDHGLSWANDIDPGNIQVADLQSASLGKRFAFLVWGWKNARFHGERLDRHSTLLIYDLDKSVPVYRLDVGDGNVFALSPDGTQIAVSHDNIVKVYSMK